MRLPCGSRPRCIFAVFYFSIIHSPKRRPDKIRDHLTSELPAGMLGKAETLIALI